VGNVEAMPADADTETLVIIGAWINPNNIYDVDGSGTPTARDALLIINELGRRAVSDPDTEVLTPLPPAGYAPPHYDVSGDGKCTALDALRVINQLARLDVALRDPIRDTAAVNPTPFAGLAFAATSDRSQVIDEAVRQSLFATEPVPSLNVWMPAESATTDSLETAFNVQSDKREAEATLAMLADDVAMQWSLEQTLAS
jgi:hypothetical protein